MPPWVCSSVLTCFPVPCACVQQLHRAKRVAGMPGAFMQPGTDSTGAGARQQPSYLAERRRYKRDRGDDTQRAGVRRKLVELFVSNGGAVTGKHVHKWFVAEVRVAQAEAHTPDTPPPSTLPRVPLLLPHGDVGAVCHAVLLQVTPNFPGVRIDVVKELMLEVSDKDMRGDVTKFVLRKAEWETFKRTKKARQS